MRRSFTVVGEGRAEGMEKETQRYYHTDILQITLFSPLQL